MNNILSKACSNVSALQNEGQLPLSIKFLLPVYFLSTSLKQFVFNAPTKKPFSKESSLHDVSQDTGSGT